MPHNIYIVRLSPDVMGVRRFRDANETCRPDRPCVYVGRTAKEPAVRFQQHLDGYKACALVTRFGLELIPRLFKRWQNLSFDDAVRMEVEIARRLRKRGYAVWQK